MSEFEVQNISRAFAGIQAVDGFSFHWGEHRIVGLIGPNGAGKTTLFNILTGFLQADSGNFYLNGENILGLLPHRILKKGIARTFQDLRLLRQIRVIENVLLWQQKSTGEEPFSAWLRGKKYRRERQRNLKKAKEILEFVGLIEKANDLAEALSYGQQKLLSLGCVLASDAKYLFLDEPVSGMNPQMIEKILQLLVELAKQGKRIFLIEHHIDAVRTLCDWLVVMDEGKKIAEGIPSEVLQREEIIEAYLD